ncbi:MAG TPA: AAA family ATPase [Longimicrobium sp.]|nr:AAA family ATPase [Longimicrobium sp.]
MITSITIQNWKSFREARLAVAPLTLMLGANASGKSNAIEAIRCLSWLAEGRRLSEIVSSVQGDDQLIRGTIADLTRHDEPSIFHQQCDLNHGRRVVIWSYDQHLQSYDRAPLL